MNNQVNWMQQGWECSKCGAKRHFMARKDCKWSMIDWPKSKGEN